MNTQSLIQTAEPISSDTTEARPYPPSYIDRLMNTVRRLPIPYWLTYLILFILLGIGNHIINWVDGWLPPYTLSPFVLSLPLWLCVPLALMTYLNGAAREALSNVRPLLDLPNEAMRRLEYEFTTIPQRTALIITVVWLVLYVGIAASSLDTYRQLLGLGALAMTFETVAGVFAFGIGGMIYYHSLRQLRLVTKTTKLVKHYNLFHRDPAYAFSALTARTGIAWMILFGLNVITVPIASTAGNIILPMAQVILAVLVFVVPLRVVNEGLVAEKRKLLAEHDARVESVLAELHHAIEHKASAEVARLNDILTALNAEQTILEKIPTWPWRAGLFAGFLSIVVLPIILILFQLVLSRLLT